jgi:chromosomal replication initiation ATPase DnaA
MDEFLSLEESKVIHFLLNVINESITMPIYIHGPEKCGKSHLLYAFYENKARMKEVVVLRSGKSLSNSLDDMSLSIRKARAKEHMEKECAETVGKKRKGWLVIDDIDGFDFRKSKLINKELVRMIERTHVIITSKKYPHELESDVVREALKDAVIFEMGEIGEKSRYRILEKYTLDRGIWVDPKALYMLAELSADVDKMKDLLDKAKVRHRKYGEPINMEDLNAFL